MIYFTQGDMSARIARSRSRHEGVFKKEVGSLPRSSGAHSIGRISETGGLGATPYRAARLRIKSSCSLSPPVSQRKQRFPQPKSVDEDDDDVSNISDYEDDDIKFNFGYNLSTNRSAAAGGEGTCDWCSRVHTVGDLTLTSNDRVTKSFCSEDCQQLFKVDVLRAKVCEWCGEHFPTKSSLIVVEPSAESVPLQFCTQSCINKYKMELFCVEVKEQLRRIKDENVQLPMTSTKLSHSERKILITPELWNEGESALVFVNEPTPDISSDTNNNAATGNGCHERKRKGDSMENVISKLSRRNNRYSSMSSEEPSKLLTASLSDTSQSTPINLTLQRSEGSEEIRRGCCKARAVTNTNRVCDSTEQVDKRKLAAVTAHWTGPTIIPLPILLPVPIPIPISVGSIPRLRDKSASTANGNSRQEGDKSIPQRRESLRLIADEPE